jgi:hypothetical protein
VRHALAQHEKYGELTRAETRILAREMATPARPGRRGRPDIEYARLARLYLDFCHKSTTPMKDMAAHQGYTEHALRNLLYEARHRGLLTDAPKGRYGGELTDKAVHLLEEER